MCRRPLPQMQATCWRKPYPMPISPVVAKKAAWRGSESSWRKPSHTDSSAATTEAPGASCKGKDLLLPHAGCHHCPGRLSEPSRGGNFKQFSGSSSLSLPSPPLGAGASRSGSCSSPHERRPAAACSASCPVPQGIGSMGLPGCGLLRHCSSRGGCGLSALPGSSTAQAEGRVCRGVKPAASAAASVGDLPRGLCRPRTCNKDLQLEGFPKQALAASSMQCPRAYPARALAHECRGWGAGCCAALLWGTPQLECSTPQPLLRRPCLLWFPAGSA